MQPVAAAGAGPPAWSYDVTPGLYLVQRVGAGGVALAQKAVALAEGGNPDVIF